jgi:hypothetical protein
MVRAVKKMLAACPGGAWARVIPTGQRQPAGLALRRRVVATLCLPSPADPDPRANVTKAPARGGGQPLPGPLVAAVPGGGGRCLRNKLPS